MNGALIETIRRERLDVSLFALLKDEFTPEAIEEARQSTRTVAYFFDDDWRREYFASWAPHFDFLTTPRQWTYRQYQAAGMRNVLYSPFAFNVELYCRAEVPKRYDVSFVGGNHPWRVFVIDRLKRGGINVAGFRAYLRVGGARPAGVGDGVFAPQNYFQLSNSPLWGG